MQRRFPFLLVWTSFYEQLAWAPMLVVLAAGTGDATVVSLAAVAYSLANLFGNLLFGYLADKTSRYRVAGAGLAFMSLTALLHAAATTPQALVGARFLHGLAAAAVAPAALAAVVQGVSPDRKGERMARVGMVIALASMLSPMLNGRLATWLGVQHAVYLLAGFVALVAVLSIRTDAKDLPPAATLPWQSQAEKQPVTALDPALALAACVVAFAVMFIQNVLFYALPLKGANLGMGPGQVGPLLSAFAVGAMIAFAPPLSRLSDRWGRRLPILAGLLASAGAMAALASAEGAGVMAAALFAHGLGFGLVFPAVSALSGDAAGQARRGMAYGILTAAFSAGAIVGPLVTRSLTPLYDPFAVAAVVATTGAVLTAAGALYRPSGLPRSY